MLNGFYLINLVKNFELMAIKGLFFSVLSSTVILPSLCMMLSVLSDA